ncbi:hypothetical protein HYY69_04040 [Candidatus Woesearchaeota archaeon]|nr:hypothetical protein [Candidatus Woesearchaeota archaeon]
MQCDECNKGTLQHKKADYVLLGINLGKFDALVCSSCSEVIYTGDTFKEVEKIAKQKGLWGISGRTKIGTSGNALDVKLPKSLIEFHNLKRGQEVVIEPIDKRRFQVIVI